MQNKIPVAFDMDKIQRGLGTELAPTTVVLLQELARWNMLTEKMSKSLAELQRVKKNGFWLKNKFLSTLFIKGFDW